MIESSGLFTALALLAALARSLDSVAVCFVEVRPAATGRPRSSSRLVSTRPDVVCKVESRLGHPCKFESNRAVSVGSNTI